MGRGRLLGFFDLRARAGVEMGTITIEVWDATGNKKQQVELPPDAEIGRVIAVLVGRMNLPKNSPDGQLLSYKFHHRASGRQLLDDETLAGAGVQQGDVLRLQPEITAGSFEGDRQQGVVGRARA
jgi:WXG100 protein secretion system (Wss), protein YukD